MTESLHNRLTRREREIVNVLFALGNRGTVEDIRARLDKPPSDSSIRVMLTRLARKGVTRHVADGTRNVYAVTTSPAAAKKHLLRDYVQTFFAGSRRLLLTSLLRDGGWSDEDLDALRTEIDRIRAGKKR